ncbi:MAG: hypothetical protein EXQ92_05560 [Alphaproteobacteria bacterium]|nr:hypothetical protein [Alphaproteobacteria bacterium]
MDLKLLKEEALEATARFFRDSLGTLPDQESDEWEAAYRRHFELAKKKHAPQAQASPQRLPPAVSAEGRTDKLPELSGPTTEKRWAATLRADRLEEIQSKDIRIWLAGAWTASKIWVDTRDLPAPAFLRRIEAEYGASRRRADKQAVVLQAEQNTKAATAEAVRQRVQAAGITAEGLIGLVDVSPRAKAAAAKAKLAELSTADRHMRIFETTNPATLMVIEKAAADRTEYAIERDEGLVTDLKLFTQSGVS